jgi:hypothetical protein
MRMLGDVSGRRILDAGCGNGYFARLLAARGARVVGVEPGEAMVSYARAKERELGQGIDYPRADLTRLPDLGGAFDAVVCSMVLMAIPGWRAAMRACVRCLRPGGLFVFSIVHPAFEDLWASWRRHGEYHARRYLVEYELFWWIASHGRGGLPRGPARGGGWGLFGVVGASQKRRRGGGWPLFCVGPSLSSSSFCVCVRRCPTLPRTCVRSTIGAGGLNCRVRYGAGCFPAAVTTETSIHALLCCCWGSAPAGCGVGFVFWVLYSGREYPSFEGVCVWCW